MNDHDALATALRGIHVVTLAPNVPGPVAARRLHEMGARVTKIEPPAGDPLAAFAPGWYADLHAGIDVVRLDLKLPHDRAALAGRLNSADALLTSSRPSALVRLGLDRASIAAAHPQLVHVAIVGELPPREERAGHDLTYVAQFGLLDPPRMPLTLLADLAGAERAAGAVLALLLQRAATGSAARAYVSLRDAAQSFAAPLVHGMTERDGVLGGASPAYQLYRASDGWIALAALEPHFWAHVCALFEILPDAGAERVAGIFATRTAAAWESWADANDIPLVSLSRDGPSPQPSRRSGSA